MSENLRSSTENKYGKKTKIAAGLLAATGLIGGLVACGDNNDVVKAPISSETQSANPLEAMIDKYTDDDYAASYMKIESWAERDANYGQFQSWADMNIIPNHNGDPSDDLAKRFMSAGMDGLVEDVKTKNITYAEMETLKNSAKLQLDYLKLQKRWDYYGSDLNDVTISLQVIYAIASACLDNPEWVAAAQSTDESTKKNSKVGTTYTMAVESGNVISSDLTKGPDWTDGKIVYSSIINSTGSNVMYSAGAMQEIFNYIQWKASQKNSKGFNTTINAGEATALNSVIVSTLVNQDAGKTLIVDSRSIDDVVQ